MNKLKIRMIISLIIVAILLVQVAIPMFSLAGQDELTVELSKVEVDDGYQITVSGSSPSKILALSYVAERKTATDFDGDAQAVIDYFEGSNAIALNITSDMYLNEIFTVSKNTATYTVYSRNLEGEIVLAYISINQTSEINLEVSVQENDGDKSLSIQATSTSNITEVKVAKTTDPSVRADFTNVTNILQESNTTVSTEYPLLENGTYQVYVKDENKNVKIKSISVFDGETPITIQTATESNTITINVTDTIADISELKIAKSSEITNISDFSTVGTDITFTGTTSISTIFEVAEEGQYIIFVKDAAGNSLMQSVSVTTKPEQTIDFYRVTGEENVVYVLVENNLNNITYGQYLISDEQKTMAEVKSEGNMLNINPDKALKIKISSEDITTTKFISIYVRDELGYGKMSGILIGNIEIVDELPTEDPETPVEEDPETPVEEDPETPVEEDPETPVEEDPETPVEGENNEEENNGNNDSNKESENSNSDDTQNDNNNTNTNNNEADNGSTENTNNNQSTNNSATTTNTTNSVDDTMSPVIISQTGATLKDYIVLGELLISVIIAVVSFIKYKKYSK